MKIFIALIALLALTAAAGVYIYYPAGEFAWMERPYKNYKNTRSRLNYKAIAVDLKERKYGQALSFPGPEAAMEQAFYSCRKIANNCELYALGDKIVIGMDALAIKKLIEPYWSRHATRIFSSPWKGDKFSGGEIETALAGITAYGINRNGLRTQTIWEKSGTLKSDVLNNFARPPKKDSGKWWVKGDKLCRQYMNWYSGQELCGVLRRDGDDFLIYGDNKELLVIFKQVGD